MLFDILLTGVETPPPPPLGEASSCDVCILSSLRLTRFLSRLAQPEGIMLYAACLSALSHGDGKTFLRCPAPSSFERVNLSDPLPMDCPFSRLFVKRDNARRRTAVDRVAVRPSSLTHHAAIRATQSSLTDTAPRMERGFPRI